MAKSSTPLNGSNHAALDRYLGRCVEAFLASETCPPWPKGVGASTDAIAARIAFHGIALVLVETHEAMANWPAAIANTVREEAHRQSFWETSHKEALARVTRTLNETGVQAVLTKGSALAYSVYPNPALRRRGDSDLVVLNGPKNAVRASLRSCGFKPCHDARALQETWQCDAPPNFTHHIDLHWRINASAAISEQLERMQPFERTIPLPRLSDHARGLGPVENLILTCVNRAAHAMLGYGYDGETVFEGDRLIWAVDIGLVAASLSDEGWRSLVDQARRSGTASAVSDGLVFAQTACGIDLPADILSRLDKARAENENVPNADVAALLAPSAMDRRFARDWASSKGFAAKMSLLRYAAFPSPAFFHTRYPSLRHWPYGLLTARRLGSGVFRRLGRLVRRS